MCGISALFLKNGAVDFREPILKKLMHHRGKDGFGYYTSDNVCMAVSMHRVIGMGTAVQPFQSDDARFVLIGNGDVYNYRELGGKLFPANDSPILSYDLAVALEAFTRYGASAFNVMRGPFALIIWDDLKKELWVTRDGLGERTLYYYSDASFYFFSSEVRIIEEFVRSTGKTLNVAESEIIKFIGTGRVGNDEQTIFESVKEIYPGTILNVSASGITVNSIKTQSQPLPFDSAQENINVLLDQALKRVFTADTDISLAFSGGIDSTFILDHALKTDTKLSSVMTVYSATGKSRDKNLSRSKKIADYLGIKVDYIPFETPGFSNVVDILGNFFDGPVAEPIALHNHVLHSYAGKKSKVLIGGHGADEAFEGYNRYTNIHQQIEKTGKDYSPETLIALVDKLDWERLSRILNWPSALHGLIDPAQLFHLAKSNHLFLNSILKQHTNAIRIAQLIDFSLQYYDNFRVPDENGICNGVEVRSPFFDCDLLSYAFSLPRHTRLKSNDHKCLIQNAFYNKGLLRFLQKSKVGFDDFFQYKNWVRETKGPIEEFIFLGPLARMGLLDKTFKRNGKNIRGLFDTNWRLMWRLFSISVWLEKRAVMSHF